MTSSSDESQVLGDLANEKETSRPEEPSVQEEMVQEEEENNASRKTSNTDLFKQNSNLLKGTEERRNSKLISLIRCLLCCAALPITALVICSFSIAAAFRDSECGGDMLRLQMWLTVFGIELTLSVFVVVGYLLLAKADIAAGVYLGLCGIPLCLFSLAWNIVGAVALFRDSMDCKTEAPSLWGMVLAALIIQWIVFCCGGASSNRSG